jgi:hypothetical protein
MYTEEKEWPTKGIELIDVSVAETVNGSFK